MAEEHLDLIEETGLDNVVELTKLVFEYADRQGAFSANDLAGDDRMLPLGLNRMRVKKLIRAFAELDIVQADKSLKAVKATDTLRDWMTFSEQDKADGLLYLAGDEDIAQPTGGTPDDIAPEPDIVDAPINEPPPAEEDTVATQGFGQVSGNRFSSTGSDDTVAHTPFNQEATQTTSDAPEDNTANKTSFDFAEDDDANANTGNSWGSQFEIEAEEHNDFEDIEAPQLDLERLEADDHANDSDEDNEPPSEPWWDGESLEEQFEDNTADDFGNDNQLADDGVEQFADDTESDIAEDENTDDEDLGNEDPTLPHILAESSGWNANNVAVSAPSSGGSSWSTEIKAEFDTEDIEKYREEVLSNQPNDSGDNQSNQPAASGTGWNDANMGNNQPPQQPPAGSGWNSDNVGNNQPPQQPPAGSGWNSDNVGNNQPPQQPPAGSGWNSGNGGNNQPPHPNNSGWSGDNAAGTSSGWQSNNTPDNKFDPNQSPSASNWGTGSGSNSFQDSKPKSGGWSSKKDKPVAPRGWGQTGSTPTQDDMSQSSDMGDFMDGGLSQLPGVGDSSGGVGDWMEGMNPDSGQRWGSDPEPSNTGNTSSSYDGEDTLSMQELRELVNELSVKLEKLQEAGLEDDDGLELRLSRILERIKNKNNRND